MPMPSRRHVAHAIDIATLDYTAIATLPLRRHCWRCYAAMPARRHIEATRLPPLSPPLMP